MRLLLLSLVAALGCQHTFYERCMEEGTLARKEGGPIVHLVCKTATDGAYDKEVPARNAPFTWHRGWQMAKQNK